MLHCIMISGFLSKLILKVGPKKERRGVEREGCAEEEVERQQWNDKGRGRGEIEEERERDREKEREGERERERERGREGGREGEACISVLYASTQPV